MSIDLNRVHDTLKQVAIDIGCYGFMDGNQALSEQLLCSMMSLMILKHWSERSMPAISDSTERVIFLQAHWALFLIFFSSCVHPQMSNAQFYELYRRSRLIFMHTI